ncbi:SGNH/GDSL hydrolase family protein [Paenibacillus sp. NRS-1782]|uniref:SGNH/GDSL hydrolase family protein n=1 Tax=unclassified Paenibacillus TaxID=185978 RepID=UPI003D2933F6
MTINQGKYQGSHAVFLGDSITFGYELCDGEKPYPHLVSNALGFQGFENHGISGSSVASGGFEPMCERYEKMNPHADVIFFMGGRNNFSMGETPFGHLGTPSTETRTFYGALKHIAEELVNSIPNGLHPNQAGHERLAARIIGFMNTL